MKEILVLTNIAPNYRINLWLKLLNLEKFNFSFAYGQNESLRIPQIQQGDIDFFIKKNRIKTVKNIWFMKKVLIWQFGSIDLALKGKYSAIIFLGDFYCLSTWLSAVICRLRGVKVVFWGHGVYGNESRLKLILRKTFYRLANQHLLYERRAKKLMVAEGFNQDSLYVVFNSLDYDRHKVLREEYISFSKKETYHFFRNPDLKTLVFIGRLTPEKKLDILLNAAININRENIFVNLVFVGEGPERELLEKLGQNGISDKWLYFVGACYSEEEIGRYLSLSDLCVSPGNVGLTAIHSLSFGTPVCTHNNFNNQGPEAEAIIEDYNGFYFEENNIDDLINSIKNWLSTKYDRNQIRQNCYEIIDKYYNPDYQLSVFKRLINVEKPEI